MLNINSQPGINRLTSEPLQKSGIKLTERERLILRTIIHNFILSAEPLGSRALSRRYHLDLSPATIRNTLADLEEMGLLTHTHTSAGRIPTDLGYRIYVDDMMHVEEISEEMRRSIYETIAQVSPASGDLFDRVSELLSEVSRMLAVIVVPDLSSGELDKIEIVRVAHGRIMVIVVIKSGMVNTILLELDAEISDADIQQAAQLINQRLSGLRLSNIHSEITRRFGNGEAARNAIVRLFLDFPEKIFDFRRTQGMHIGSTRPILEQPEYKTTDKLKGIIELIEDRDIIVHLLKDRVEGVKVTIGNENQGNRLKDFSVITSTYRIQDELGTLGIIGPTRMNYSRLVALVEYTAQLVSSKAERARQI